MVITQIDPSAFGELDVVVEGSEDEKQILAVNYRDRSAETLGKGVRTARISAVNYKGIDLQNMPR